MRAGFQCGLRRPDHRRRRRLDLVEQVASSAELLVLPLEETDLLEENRCVLLEGRDDRGAGVSMSRLGGVRSGGVTITLDGPRRIAQWRQRFHGLKLRMMRIVTLNTAEFRFFAQVGVPEAI